MPLKVMWTAVSRQEFDTLRRRAAEAGRLKELATTLKEIVAILSDLDTAIHKGAPLYPTNKPGGEVLYFIHSFISVTYKPGSYRSHAAGPTKIRSAARMGNGRQGPLVPRRRFCVESGRWPRP